MKLEDSILREDLILKGILSHPIAMLSSSIRNAIPKMLYPLEFEIRKLYQVQLNPIT